MSRFFAFSLYSLLYKSWLFWGPRGPIDQQLPTNQLPHRRYIERLHKYGAAYEALLYNYLLEHLKVLLFNSPFKKLSY